MIAFEVLLNGSKTCVAGVDGFGVLSAIVSWVNRTPYSDPELSHPTTELTLEVGGLRSIESVHVSWLNRPLVVDDVLTINIKDLETVDEPTASVPRESEEVVREAKRRYYEELKKEFDG